MSATCRAETRGQQYQKWSSAMEAVTGLAFKGEFLGTCGLGEELA